MRVADAYNPRPIKIRSDSSLREAAELLAKTQVSDIMVVDSGEMLVGVLSEGDLIRAVIPEQGEVIESDMPLLAGFELMEEKGKEIREVKVADIMVPQPEAVTVEDPILKAAQLMISMMTGRLPVLEDGRLVGSLSRADVCRAVLAEEPEET